jgi:hypothetical protein
MGATRASYGLGHVPGRGRTPTINSRKVNLKKKVNLTRLEYRRSLSLRVFTTSLETRPLNYRVITKTLRDVKTNKDKRD